MCNYRYPWPSSAITPDDMAALHAVREASLPRVPISVLIARAVREAYGPAQPCPLPETCDGMAQSPPSAVEPRKVA